MQMPPRTAADGSVLLNHRVTPAGEPSIFVAHSHPLAECAFYLQGHIRFRWSDKEITPAAGSAMLIPQGVIHSLEAEADVPYERYTLHYYPDVLSELLQAFLHDSLLSNVYYIEEAGDLLADVLALEECFELAEEIREEAVRTRLMALVTRMASRCNREIKMQSTADVIPAVLEFIHMNIQSAHDVTVDALAQRFFISKSQLCKLFLRSTGESLAKYIRIKRFEYAELLRSRGMPAVEAASKAGFRSYSTYYRFRNSGAAVPARATQWLPTDYWPPGSADVE